MYVANATSCTTSHRPAVTIIDDGQRVGKLSAAQLANRAGD